MKRIDDVDLSKNKIGSLILELFVFDKSYTTQIDMMTSNKICLHTLVGTSRLISARLKH